MKKDNNNKNYSEESLEDDNLTFGQKETGAGEIINDNMSGEEEILADQAEDLQEKYEDLNNSYLRLHAEFDNYRKRTLKEKIEIIRAGGERVLTDMIPLVEGLELIYGKFVSFLNQNGVKEIEAIGEKFDADKFEAITTIPAQNESQKDVVLDCIQKGYKLDEKVLRFPKVIVGK